MVRHGSARAFVVFANWWTYNRVGNLGQSQPGVSRSAFVRFPRVNVMLYLVYGTHTVTERAAMSGGNSSSVEIGDDQPPAQPADS